MDHRLKNWIKNMVSEYPNHVKQLCLDVFSHEYNRSLPLGESNAICNAKWFLSETCGYLSGIEFNCENCKDFDQGYCFKQDGCPPIEWIESESCEFFIPKGLIYAKRKNTE